MDLLSPKNNNCSAKYIKFNEIQNKIFLDALSKSDARWDGKQEKFFYMALMIVRVLCGKKGFYSYEKNYIDIHLFQLHIARIRLKYNKVALILQLPSDE